MTKGHIAMYIRNIILNLKRLVPFSSLVVLAPTNNITVLTTQNHLPTAQPALLLNGLIRVHLH